MKATQQLLAVLATSSNSIALRSSVRGGMHSNSQDLLERKSSLPKRRVLQQNERRMEGGNEDSGTSYWWLDKKASEKDIVYKPEKQGGDEGSSASNGKDSFSVFTIDIDNNPDTSELPYRAPSKKPTPHPTPQPTITVTVSSTIEETVQLAPPQDSGSFTPPQDVVNYTPPQDMIVFTEKLKYAAYHYPIWTDTFKGCASSSTVPGAYSLFPDEYIFPSISSCCEAWFDSEDCSADGMIIMSSSEENLDEYMFRMNGPEAYSGGGDTSEDYSSNDGPRPSPQPPSPSEPTYTEEIVTGPPISTTVTLPPVASVSGTPSYAPTGESSVNVFPDIIGGNDTIVTGDNETVVNPVSTDPPVTAVSTQPPTPAVVVNYTPYPTFGALPDPPTPPPVFVISYETSVPTAAGSGATGASIQPTFALSIVAGTAPPVASQGTAPPVAVAVTDPPVYEVIPDSIAPTASGGTVPTQWPTFSDSFSVTPQPSSSGTSGGTEAGTSGGTEAGTSGGTEAGTSGGTEAGTSGGSEAGTSNSTVTLRTTAIETRTATRLFMSHSKSRNSDD